MSSESDSDNNTQCKRARTRCTGERRLRAAWHRHSRAISKDNLTTPFLFLSLSSPSQVRKVRKREREVWGIAVHERVKIFNPPSRARARIIVWRTLVFDRSSPRERGKFAREYSALRREITSAWCLSARRAAYIYVYIRMYCAWSRMILCVNLCWKPGWRVLFFYAIFTHRCNFDALSGRRAHTKGVYFSAGLLKKGLKNSTGSECFFFFCVYNYWVI